MYISSSEFSELRDSGTNLLSKSLSSSFSSLDTTTRELNCNNNYQLRKIWTFPPVCMGRRSGKIAGRKCKERWSKSNVKYSPGCCTDADKDQLLAIALEAGAEDVIEPPSYEDDTEEDISEK